MALVRVIPLKDFLDTALSTTASGTVLSTAPPNHGEALYTALHLMTVSTARTFVGTVQAASSSGFGGLTTEISFLLSSARGSTWQRLAAPSTDKPWRRFAWTISTGAGSTGGSWNGLAWVGFR